MFQTTNQYYIDIYVYIIYKYVYIYIYIYIYNMICMPISILNHNMCHGGKDLSGQISIINSLT